MADDTIYRQAAIDKIREVYEYEFPTASGAFDEFVTVIIPNLLRNLPSAQRIGRWIYNDYGNGCGNWHCSVCNKISIVYDKNANFCPHCGARMEVEE